MNDDRAFRAALIVLFLLVIPAGIYRRIKSQSTREKLDRRQEGAFILATLRPVGLILWIGIILWLIDPTRMVWSSVTLPDWLRWTGVGLCAMGCALVAWTLQCLGKNLTDTVVTRASHTLVTNGPYRWVRHPFYDSAALMVLGASLTAANWFLLLAGVALISLLRMRTSTEEKNLADRFGESYKAYAERTGRFLPRT